MKLIKWMPALVIVMLLGLHFLNPRSEMGKAPELEANREGSGNAEPAGEMVSVVPGSVHDGDTLRVRKGNQVIKVRLCGIDAPELAQPLGVESRDRLIALLGDGSVRMIQIEHDKYGRTVAELLLPDGKLVNAEIVKAGMAYHYFKYSGHCPGSREIVQAENEARSQRIGVWFRNSQRPWDYRKLRYPS